MSVKITEVKISFKFQAKSQASGNFLNEGGGQVRFFVLRAHQRQRMHVLYVLQISRKQQQTVDSEKSM